LFCYSEGLSKACPEKNLSPAMALPNRLLFFIKKVNEYKQPKTTRQDFFL